jgi:exopolysaccharide biosynthesis polyprenyl glycosylphosphotransferase
VISRVYYYNVLLRIVVYSLPLFAFGLSSYIRFRSVWPLHVNSVIPQDYLALLLFTELVWIFATNHYKLSSVTNLFWEHTGIRAGSLASGATFLSQAALLVFMNQLNISRTFIVLSNAVLFLSVVATRNLVRLTPAVSSWPRKREKIVIVGTDQHARRVVKLLRRVPFFRCDIQAYLQLPGQPVVVDDAPVLSAGEPLHLETLSFDEVVVAIPAERYMQVSPIIDGLQGLGKPVRAILDLGPRLSVREKLFQVGRLQMMSLGFFPIESFAYTVLKRGFDLAFAAFALIVMSPVFAIVALLVRLSSPGPILFRQDRIGQHGSGFTLLKFRTMTCSATVESDTIWTTQGDSRCTAIGAVLRKFSLDELPQLINVLRGEMSLVGPRPERPYFVAKFRKNIQRYNARHCCQVGITGWAQVNGLRGDTSISDRLQHDLYYMHNWSFALDLQILARTMFTVLRGENGY